jgi:rRNA maturation RNase YbeY
MEEMKPAIHFFSENIPFVLKGKRMLRAWLMDCIAREKKQAGMLNFIFCDDAYLLPINRSYLHHDTLTDIITFDYTDQKGKVQGDIFISIERARYNAALFEVSTDNEIRRLLIHGVLHLCGYDDKDPEGKRLMSEKEDYYLSLLP